MPSEKEQFLQTWDREFQTTLKVLRAYPPEKLDLKPAEKSKSARDLLFVFRNEAHFFSMALDNKLDFTAPSPQVPATLGGIIEETEKANAALVAKLRQISDTDYNGMVTFAVAPKTMGQVRRMDLCWMMLMDMVHHRGQISVYIRLAGGKVPSIYGPTADEPWM